MAEKTRHRLWLPAVATRNPIGGWNILYRAGGRVRSVYVFALPDHTERAPTRAPDTQTVNQVVK